MIFFIVRDNPYGDLNKLQSEDFDKFRMENGIEKLFV